MSSAVPDLRVIWGNVIFVHFAFSSNDRRAGSGACYNWAVECSRLGQRWRPSLLRGSLANTAGQWQTETGEPSLALSALEDLWQTSEGSKWQWQLCTVGLRTEDLHFNSCSRGRNLPWFFQPGCLPLVLLVYITWLYQLRLIICFQGFSRTSQWFVHAQQHRTCEFQQIM